MNEYITNSFILFAVGSIFCIGLIALMFSFIKQASKRRVQQQQNDCLTSNPDSTDLHVQLDNLMAARAALDEDHAADRLSDEAHTAATLEVDHHLLRLSDDLEKIQDSSGAKSLNRLAICFILILPISTALIYSGLGRPDLVDNPLANRGVEIANYTTSITTEKQKLKQNFALAQAASLAAPDNVEVWLRLAESAAAINDSTTEILALRKARTMTNDDPTLLSLLAEALSRAAEGQVTIPARELIKIVLSENPLEPRALFLFGLAAFQDGKYKNAISRWQRLLAISATDAPWLTIVRNNIQKAAEAGNIELTTQSGPDGDSISAAADLSPEARKSMILSMVKTLHDRLKENPTNTDGWLRLVRAYDVLDSQAEAFTALVRATQSAPEDISLHFKLLERTIGTSLNDQQLAFAKEVLNRIKKQAPDGPQYLFFKGHLASLSGDTETARLAWTQLLKTIPAQNKMAKELAEEIRKLE